MNKYYNTAHLGANKIKVPQYFLIKFYNTLKPEVSIITGRPTLVYHRITGLSFSSNWQSILWLLGDDTLNLRSNIYTQLQKRCIVVWQRSPGVSHVFMVMCSRDYPFHLSDDQCCGFKLMTDRIWEAMFIQRYNQTCLVVWQQSLGFPHLSIVMAWSIIPFM